MSSHQTQKTEGDRIHSGAITGHDQSVQYIWVKIYKPKPLAKRSSLDQWLNVPGAINASAFRKAQSYSLDHTLLFNNSLLFRENSTYIKLVVTIRFDFFLFIQAFLLHQSTNDLFFIKKNEIACNNDINLNSLFSDLTWIASWIGFYGLLTFVCYLMPNPFYTNKYFSIKQFSFA